MKDLQPTCMDDIIAGVSLFRPGPMDFIPKFVKNKQDPEHIEYEDPCLEDILDVTYGCIVYQEQVMKIFQVMAGYSLGQADNIRRIMGKKQVEKIDKERVKFVNGWEDPEGKKSIPGAIKLGHKKEVAEKIFDEMKEFAKYAFNKSHAAAYAYITYQTAYLKYYYEVEYLTAVLNNRITKADSLTKYINFAKSEGISVLPPDVNKSGTYFKVEGKGIRFGLGGLKHVGTAIIEQMEKEREMNGEFKSMEDFIDRMSNYQINKKMIECLILSGAFDSFGKTRSSCMAIYEKLMQKASKDKKTRQTGQISFFATNEIEDKVEYPDIKEFNKKTLLKNERDIIGVYMSGHPLEDHVAKFKNFTINSEMINSLIKPEEEIADESEEEKISEELQQDLTGTLEIVLFPNVFAKYRSIIVEDNMITVKGKINVRDAGDISLIGDSIFLWSEEEKEKEKKVTKSRLVLRFDTKDIDIYSKVKNTLLSYPGDIQVVIRCTSSGSAFNYQSKVTMNNYLLNELSGIIGSENIVYQE